LYHAIPLLPTQQEILQPYAQDTRETTRQIDAAQLFGIEEEGDTERGFVIRSKIDSYF